MKNKKRFMRLALLLMGVFLVFAINCSKDDDDNSSSFTDSRDSKTYNWVKIGEQVWMAENLAYAPSNGNYWAYDSNDANVETYGYLYDWETACDVCPDGWHLPSDAEWVELTVYLGGKSIAGRKMKEIGTSHWDSPNEKATNKSGFSALPGGVRDNDGTFDYMGHSASFWTSTGNGNSDAWHLRLYYHSGCVYRYDYVKDFGFSVRCIRD
ncbi:MAG: FISUMP domain-containing protein [Bacteroidota bacterium]|nr:FISUMP domain-containing protein [Bacteroidota bacterium]